MRDGRRAQRPQSAHHAQRRREQRIPREPREELGMVVVEAEHEADVLDARLALRTDADRAVGPLPREHALELVLASDRRRVDAVEDRPRRIAVPRGDA